MHPSNPALIAFCDSELDPARYRRIASHLSKCEECRAGLQRIRQEKDRLSVREAAIADLQLGLAHLRSSMAAWQAGRTGAASELQERLGLQLETYLGAGASSAVKHPGLPAEEVLASATRMLNIFLGPAAAEALRDDALRELNCAGVLEISR